MRPRQVAGTARCLAREIGHATRAATAQLGGEQRLARLERGGELGHAACELGRQIVEAHHRAVGTHVSLREVAAAPGVVAGLGLVVGLAGGVVC